MKVLVIGAGGIIGQHLMAQQPADIETVYTRRHGNEAWGYRALNMADSTALAECLEKVQPDAIINLAGENRPDVVERAPQAYRLVNVEVPAFLAHYCRFNKKHFVQVSSQAVFGGMPEGVKDPRMIASFSAPYSPTSPRMPVNQYGLQKLHAESEVMTSGAGYWTIVRPTFVLGVRKIIIGRENPIEQMLAPVKVVAEGETVAAMRQVADRWFSVSFAWQVAHTLWQSVLAGPLCAPVHVGIPFRTNRHILASYLRPDLNVEPVSHDSFEGLAPRPVDTTYAGEGSFADIVEGLERCRAEYEARG